MPVNVSIWIRAFRPPLQRAYPRLGEVLETIDADFADLLRRADDRGADAPEPAPVCTTPPRTN